MTTQGKLIIIRITHILWKHVLIVVDKSTIKLSAAVVIPGMPKKRRIITVPHYHKVCHSQEEKSGFQYNACFLSKEINQTKHPQILTFRIHVDVLLLALRTAMT